MKLFLGPVPTLPPALRELHAPYVLPRAAPPPVLGSHRVRGKLKIRRQAPQFNISVVRKRSKPAICSGDAPFGGAFVPPCFWAQSVATRAKARKAARRGRGIRETNSDALASRRLLTRNTHAANDTAAPTRASLVMKSVMLHANYTISAPLRCGISPMMSFHSFGSFWFACAILYQTKFKRSSSFKIHK